MTDYYWCFKHDNVEQGPTCRAANRLGPYESAEAARQWRERLEHRNDEWEAEDERWHGTDGEGGGEG